MTTDFPLKTIQRLAERIADRYTCRFVSRDDRVSAAILSAIEAGQTYDPAKGDFATYAACAMRTTVVRLVYTSSSPVSVSVGAQARGVLRTISRTGIEHCALAAHGNQEQQLQHAELTWRVRQQVKEALAELKDSELAISVLLDGEEPRTVAEKANRPVHAVYKAVTRGNNILRGTRELRPLWRELAA